MARGVGGGKPFSPHQSTGTESHRTHDFSFHFCRKRRQRNRRNIIIIRTISTSICCPSVPFSKFVTPSTWDWTTPNHCAPVHPGELLDWKWPAKLDLPTCHSRRQALINPANLIHIYFSPDIVIPARPVWMKMISIPQNWLAIPRRRWAHSHSKSHFIPTELLR